MNYFEQCCVILTTTDDENVAYKLGELLVKEKISACVQIDKVSSIFLWDGKMTEKLEYRLMIKALSEHYSDIEDMIYNNHNYELPEIVKLPITDCLAGYLNWMKDISSPEN